jgi:mono/diheme cytochrome c family protein
MEGSNRVRKGEVRWMRWTVVGLSAGAALAAALAVSCTATQQAPAPMSQGEKITRGKQISYSSGCNDCHSPGGLYGAPDTTRLLSGSELGWEGPWGVSYPRNLTPDMETGIGSWSEEDIVTAIRAGHRPDKSPLLPPMPWPAYARMSDDDAYALAAFLKSLPPIKHKSPDQVPPGKPATGARLTFPPPPAWDAQHLPPPPAAQATTGK